MNIFLIGFMGSGKTTVGRRLAKRLRYHFVDMDAWIADQQHQSIAEIFETQGEAKFRELETQTIQTFSQAKHSVISTGGGVVTTEGNIQMMKQIGKVIYLEASFETIWERVTRRDTRPLVRNQPKEVIQGMLEQRVPLYQQADFSVDTTGLLPYPIVTKIIQAL